MEAYQQPQTLQNVRNDPLVLEFNPSNFRFSDPHGSRLGCTKGLAFRVNLNLTARSFQAVSPFVIRVLQGTIGPIETFRLSGLASYSASGYGGLRVTVRAWPTKRIRVKSGMYY